MAILDAPETLLPDGEHVSERVGDQVRVKETAQTSIPDEARFAALSCDRRNLHGVGKAISCSGEVSTDLGQTWAVYVPPFASGGGLLPDGTDSPYSAVAPLNPLPEGRNRMWRVRYAPLKDVRTSIAVRFTREHVRVDIAKEIF